MQQLEGELAGAVNDEVKSWPWVCTRRPSNFASSSFAASMNTESLLTASPSAAAALFGHLAVAPRRSMQTAGSCSPCEVITASAAPVTTTLNSPAGADGLLELGRRVPSLAFLQQPVRRQYDRALRTPPPSRRPSPAPRGAQVAPSRAGARRWRRRGSISRPTSCWRTSRSRTADLQPCRCFTCSRPSRRASTSVMHAVSVLGSSAIGTTSPSSASDSSCSRSSSRLPGSS